MGTRGDLSRSLGCGGLRRRGSRRRSSDAGGAALNFAPRFDWVGQIVFNGRPENIDAVFVDGRALKFGGRLVDIDTNRVVREAEAAAARLRAAG